jgi:hypothetical protein
MEKAQQRGVRADAPLALHFQHIENKPWHAKPET